MAEQARFANGKDIDRLSNLPDDVICHIISYLPIRETTRTSILSRRWRYLFAWTASLTIDFDVDSQSYIGYSFVYKVNKVLFSRRASINKFCLKFKKYIDPSLVDGWIHYALSHGVKELELCFAKYFKFNQLPSASWLFACKTLVRLGLKFRQYFTLEVPDTVRLPNLKVLRLRQIIFSDDESVQRLFSRCCVLEELVVQRCIWGRISKFSVSNPTLKRLILRSLICSNPYQELVINAPSLVYFEHFDLVAKSYRLLNLQSLVEAVIDIGPIIFTFFYKTAAPDLLRGISNIQSLHLGCRFSKVRIFALILDLLILHIRFLQLTIEFSFSFEGLSTSSSSQVPELDLSEDIYFLLI